MLRCGSWFELSRRLRHTARNGTNVLPEPFLAVTRAPQEPLTIAQQELYDWLADYIGTHRHSPSIRPMMQAMGLRSPAPIQSRLRHLQQKGWITWQEGQARTLQLLGDMVGAAGIPVLGAVAAGGLVTAFDDVQEHLDLAPVLETHGLFALTVNGDSMVDSHIADGDVVLMEPVQDPQRLRNGTVVSALVAAVAPRSNISIARGRRWCLKLPTPLINRLSFPPNRWRCRVAWLPSGGRSEALAV